MSNKSVLGASQNCVLSVDLQNKDQAAQVVKDCHINLKRRNFFIGLMRAPKPVKYRLEVAYNLDERLVVAKGESVLLLRYREFQGAAITLDVGKDAHVFDFQLYFDAAKIVDCTEKEGMGTDEFAISYTIRAVRVDTNEVAQTIKGEATIKLQKLTFAAPKIEFRPNKVGENLVYNLLTTQPLEIGQLRVRNAADLLRSPASTIQMRVVARRVVGKRQLGVDELMWFGKDIKQTHPRAVATDNALTPLSGDASNFKFEMMSRDEVVLSYIDVNKAQSDSARNDNEVVVPVMWDMSKVKNPIGDEEQYCIFIEAVVASELDMNRSSRVTYNDLFATLKRNRNDMNLEVSFCDENERVVESGKVLPRVVPDIIPDMTTTYEFRLRNSAEYAVEGKEGARIFIKELAMPLNFGSVVKQQNGVRDSLITFVDANRNSVELERDFALGLRESRSIRFVYDHSCIDTLMSGGKTVFEAEHKIALSFKYYLDKENEYNSAEEIAEDKFEQFRTTLPILLRKASKPEWLCIDLGTSAIVASYGTFLNANGQIAENLIQLGAQKRKLMNETHGADRNKTRDTSESDDRFINSTMVVNLTHLFRNANVLAPLVADYKRQCLWLSPTTGMVDFYARMLPSLKSIVGHRVFPKSLLPYGVQMSEDDPVKVEAIFKNTYEQLFKFFIPEGPSNETDNIVMTVPNTYTPANIAMLRNIIKTAMPQLRNVRFISESDAVVFYYLARRERIFRKTEIATTAEVDKNILVYDMGAGTLDITYVTRSEEDGKIDINFKGKLGVSRAGNYLDYLIAEIVVEFFIAELKKRVEAESDERRAREVSKNIDDLRTIISLDGNLLTQAHRKSAGVLKAFVRNVVKPLLNSADDTSIIIDKELQTVQDLIADPAFRDENILSQITVGRIKSNEKMTAYLQEISKDVFTHFNKLFSRGDEVVRPSLLIFSGRSTSLLMIRQAVRDALSVFGCADNCKFLDLTRECISDNIQAIDASAEIGSLKTVIVDGAMAFCKLFGDGRGSMQIHNSNVYAQYGAMFLMNNGAWEWVPMIDAWTRPINEDKAVLSNDGTTIYEYDTREHRASQVASIGNMALRSLEKNFDDVASMYILQSYSSNTLSDWEEGRRDLITIIGAADNFGNIGQKPYYMTIDGQSQISFHIGAAQRDMYPREDIISESFKKSMWPIVECNNKK